MNYNPECPKCGNATSALSVVDVEIDGWHLKGIKCNNPECGCYISFFIDYEEEIKYLKEKINDLSYGIESLE